MSVVVSGPRRVYVVLVVWQRLTEGCGGCPRSLSRAVSALDVDDATATTERCHPVCRLVLRLALHRVLWRRLIGFSILVLDPRAAVGEAA